MVYEPTKNGHSHYLVENGQAFFSIKEDDGFLHIITKEEDYKTDCGKNADLMIKFKVSLPEKKKRKKAK